MCLSLRLFILFMKIRLLWKSNLKLLRGGPEGPGISPLEAVMSFTALWEFPPLLASLRDSTFLSRYSFVWIYPQNIFQNATDKEYPASGPPAFGIRHLTPDFWPPTSGTGHPTPVHEAPSIGYPVRDTRHPTSDTITQLPTPDTRHPAPDTRPQTPDIQRPMSCSLSIFSTKSLINFWANDPFSMGTNLYPQSFTISRSYFWKYFVLESCWWSATIVKWSCLSDLSSFVRATSREFFLDLWRLDESFVSLCIFFSHVIEYVCDRKAFPGETFGNWEWLSLDIFSIISEIFFISTSIRSLHYDIVK